MDPPVKRQGAQSPEPSITALHAQLLGEASLRPLLPLTEPVCFSS